MAKALLIFLWLLLAAAMSVIMFACTPQKRLARMAHKNPLAAAIVCADMFPVKESVEVRYDTVSNTLYMPGEVMYVDCDSAKAHRQDTGRLVVRIPCPPMQLITRLVTKDSIVRVENTAALYAARTQSGEWQAKCLSARHTRNILWCIAGILLAYTVFRILARIYLRIALP